MARSSILVSRTFFSLLSQICIFIYYINGLEFAIFDRFPHHFGRVLKFISAIAFEQVRRPQESVDIDTPFWVEFPPKL